MLGLNPQQTQDFEKETLMNGRTFDPSVVSAGVFDGGATAIPMGLAQGIIAQPGQLIADAIDPPLAAAGRKVDEIFGTDIEGFFKRDQEAARNLVKSLTPDPKTTGAGAQALYSLSSVIPQVIAGAVTGWPAGAAVLPSTIQGYSETVRQSQEGVDPVTALEMGGLTALTTGIGVLMPAALGTGLATKAVTGAALNTAVGIPSRYGASKILEANGYSEMAKQIDPLDTTALISDIVLGAGFGTVAHYFPHEATDAAIVARNNYHAEIETAPGIPADTQSRNNHNKAVDAKIEELLTGERKDVGEFMGEFIPDPEKTAAYDLMQSAIEESGLGDIMRQNDEMAKTLTDIGIDPKYSRFVSTVEQTVSSFKQEKASGEQYLNMLKNTAGVKAEELDWMGLPEFLAGKKSVTKQEVMDFIAQNKVQLEEVTLGNDPVMERAKVLAEQENGVGSWNRIGGGGQQHYIRDAVRELKQSPQEKPKYSDRTLPGGENYREVLLTLPPTEGGKFDPSKVKIERKRTSTTQGWVTLSYDGKKLETYADPIELNQATGQYESTRSDESWIASAKGLFEKGSYDKSVKPISSDFRSQHFDQPNILAHVRLNDRVDAEGKKVLFVEEIQSDWHQAGRKKGYKQNYKEEEVQPISVEEAKKQYGPDNADLFWFFKVPDNVLQIPRSRWATQAEARQYVLREKFKGGGDIPDAPFKKTWHELAFKRILQEAVAKGYDRVAWTTGEQQAARYDLSKQVDEVVYYPNTKDLQAFKGGEEVIYKKGVEQKDLPDLIGKEAADKIINSPTEKTPAKEGGYNHTLKGADLKVGGEGMKGFYDKIIPDYAKKLGKKYGAKVGETKISAEGEDVPDILYDVVLPNGKVVEQVDGPKRAAAIARNFEGAVVREVDTRSTVHSMDITPELRAAVEGGLPMFARGVGKGATVEDMTNAVRSSFCEATDALMKAGKIKVVQSAKDIPGKHPDDVRGMTDKDGNVYIVADNVSPEMAKSIVLHEVGVHAGMEKMLGKRLFANVIKDIDTLHLDGNEAVRKAREAVPVDTTPEHIAEETLAYLVQNAPELPLVQRVLAAVRQWLYKVTGGKFISLTEADLREMAVAALKKRAQDGATGKESLQVDKENLTTGNKYSSEDQISKFKVKPPKRLFRGVAEGLRSDGETGYGVGMMGKGIYSSPDKSFAKMYAVNGGKVVELTPEEAFPRNPLVLHNVSGGAPGAFFDWIFKNSSYKNMREFHKDYPDPGAFVREHGYDGIVAGDEVVYFGENDTSTDEKFSKAPTTLEDQILADRPDIRVVNESGYQMFGEEALAAADEKISEATKNGKLAEVAANCALRG